MAETDVPFYTQTAVLDTYIGKDAASLSPNVIELIAKTLRAKHELYAYFFRRRPHHSWARALLSRGYFEIAPELVKREGGWAVSRWEEQEYLISVSKDVPEVAVEHAKRIKGHASYIERAITALRAIHPDLIEEAIPLISGWLNDINVAPYISLEALSLIKILAENGSESAFTLFEKVTVPQPSGDTRTIEGFAFNSRAVALFQFDDYEERTLESVSAALQKLDARKTISILETQLGEALRVEAEATDDELYKSRTFWRVTVEDSGQDILDDYKDKLIGALRDVLEATAHDDTQNLTELIDQYLTGDYEILRRLGFHLLGLFSEKYRDLVVREILNLENLEDIEIHHEFFTLLKNGFPQLGASEREQIVHAIMIGPSQKRLDRVYNREKDEPEELRRQYMDRYSKAWMRDRLWMLKDYLTLEQSEFLNSLTGELGKPDHPDYTHWTSGAYFISAVSPLTAADLKVKSNEELLEYLRKWEPAPENFGPERESYGALGREVAHLILSDVDRYKPITSEIASLHAAFAAALVNIPIPKGGDFGSILNLRLDVCEHLLNIEQIRKSLDESPAGTWVSFRFVTVEMFEKLLGGDGDDESELTETQWLRVRDLLVRLADDPDPDLESDRPKEGWFGNNDPITVAINHVRSEAILSLIYYAQKVAVENDEKKKGDKTSRELEPVVKSVLTTKVNRRNDFSLAVHSVFGGQLNRLFWIDRKWVEEHLDEVFPIADDEEAVGFYVAAWDSYVVSPHPLFQELFSALRSRYERAIENLSKGYLTKTHLNPVASLAQHLLLDYELNNYHINSAEGRESLIAKFFAKALPEHCGEAIWQLNQRTHQNKQNWQGAKEIWVWRLEAAANANFNSDFKPEMEAFSQLLSATPETENIKTLWSLLEGFLPFIEDSENRSRIWQNVQKYLAGQVKDNPVEAIRFYSLMHDRLSGPRFYYEDEAKEIIRTGMTDNASREDTISLADKLFRRGSYEFQPIIEEALARG